MNITCPINDTGYGVASVNLVEELSKLCNLSIFPIGGQYPSFYDKNAPSLRIYHEFDCAHHPSKGKWGCLPIYELNKLQENAVTQLNANDIVFQCSKWAKQVAEDNGVKTHQVIAPLGVNTDIFSPSDQKDGPLRFLNIGKWEIRKGQDILIEAFNAAFENEDVELYLACFNRFIDNDEWIKYVLSTKLGKKEKIKIVAPMQTHREVAQLMNMCDVGVFPFRGEGWNLELLEMMACGKPVIATNYSGATEFITDLNCKLIEPDGLELAYDNLWFHGQGAWALLGKKYKEQLVEAMRDSFRTTNEEGLKTAKEFSWANTARIIYETMI